MILCQESMPNITIASCKTSRRQTSQQWWINNVTCGGKAKMVIFSNSLFSSSLSSTSSARPLLLKSTLPSRDKFISKRSLLWSLTRTICWDRSLVRHLSFSHFWNIFSRTLRCKKKGKRTSGTTPICIQKTSPSLWFPSRTCCPIMKGWNKKY